MPILHDMGRCEPCKCVVTGAAYYGEAINPRYLSVFERYVLKYGNQYDPAKEMEIRNAEVAVLR